MIPATSSCCPTPTMKPGFGALSRGLDHGPLVEVHPCLCTCQAAHGLLLGLCLCCCTVVGCTAVFHGSYHAAHALNTWANCVQPSGREQSGTNTELVWSWFGKLPTLEAKECNCKPETGDDFALLRDCGTG